MTKKIHKTIVIGLDGGCFHVFKPWMDEGELPNLKKFFDEGVSGRLESCIPPITSPAWKCYTTGKNPGKLGVFWWRQVDRKNKKMIGSHSGLFKSRELWDYLSKAGYKVGVIGMPLTYPPKKVNGFMISGGPFAKEEDFTYPKELQDDLKSKFNYRLHPFEYPTMGTWINKEIVDDILQLISMRFDVAKYLLEKENLDFLQVTTFYINVLQHRCWRKEAVRKAWKVVDKKIGELVKDNYNVLIMSDHGMCKVERTFLINTWLEKENYIKIKKDYKNDFLKPVVSLLSALKIKSAVKRFIPDKIIQNMQGKPRERLKDATAYEDRIDWNKSKAISTPQGPIYLINYQNAEEYEKLREELIEKLERLKDPDTGKKVIKKAYKREDVYVGKYLYEAPDLILEWMPGYEIREGMLGNKNIFGTIEIFADNYKYGIFLAHGPDIKKGVEVDHAKIVDLAPTILYMMGVAIPEDMDGKVLKEIFKDDSEIAKREVIYQKVEGERERIRQQLKKLKDVKKI